MPRILTCSSPWLPRCSTVTKLGRDFIPDSGRLVHLQTPPVTDTVRVDAGFIAGDEVSSHYDPMIAKLIVRGPSRESTILKLRAALEDYEIAGPVTNIEFLKRVCESPAFVAGEVETGFITKHHDELFAEVQIAPEVYVQAAIGGLLQETQNRELRNQALTGFGSGIQNRRVAFIKTKADGTADPAETAVEVKQSGLDTFDVTINGTSYRSITSHWDPLTRTITSFFLHTRLATRLINEDGKTTIFQQGKQYRLQYATPKWIEKALGVKDVANSVLAPMPCKILRVEVEEGQQVEKDQPLVVIESMKMETVIRSPQDGVVAKIVHRQGVGNASFVLSESTLTHGLGSVQGGNGSGRVRGFWALVMSDVEKRLCRVPSSLIDTCWQSDYKGAPIRPHYVINVVFAPRSCQSNPWVSIYS